MASYIDVWLIVFVVLCIFVGIFSCFYSNLFSRKSRKKITLPPGWKYKISSMGRIMIVPPNGSEYDTDLRVFDNMRDAAKCALDYQSYWSNSEKLKEETWSEAKELLS